MIPVLCSDCSLLSHLILESMNSGIIRFSQIRKKPRLSTGRACPGLARRTDVGTNQQFAPGGQIGTSPPIFIAEYPWKGAPGTMQNSPLPPNGIASQSKRAYLTGALVLAGSFILVYFWLQGFLMLAVELPANGIGMPNPCIWQYSLSNDLIWSGNTAIPFLVFVLLSMLMFMLRLARRKTNSNLPLEFGLLNLLFTAGGTGLFILLSLIYGLIFQIPGFGNWNLRLFGCEPTDAFLPGMAALGIMTAVLITFQATGWLQNPSTKRHR